MNALEQFKKLGQMASACFADDTAKEWKQGFEYKNQAMKIYHANPGLQGEMRNIAAGFIWWLDYRDEGE